MDTRAEFEALLADLFDGKADVSRQRRLEELLRSNPEWQAEYLDHMQLHALLQWRGGKIAPTPSVEQEYADPAPRPVAAGAPRWRSGRGLAAALLVVAASVAVFFLWFTPKAQATPDLFERLLEWNLELTQANTPAERNRIYAEQAAALKATLAQADLPAEDRKLAESFLDTGSMLAKNVDRAAEAERFGDLADKLVARMETATAEQDEQRVVQLADAIGRVTEVGVQANCKLAEASNLDASRRHKLAQFASRDAARSNQVGKIIERHPEPARKVIHKAMKGHFHKTKKHKR